MKRMFLTGAALAGLCTAGLPAIAVAATPKKTELKTKTVTVKTTASCKPRLTTQVAAGATTITQGAPSGTMFGASGCGKPLGAGVTRAIYSLDADSGDLTGTIQQWFNGGSVFGTFDLAPAQPSGPPTSSSFAQEAYSGTVKIKGGTGTAKGATGSGKMTCTTSDALHYSCTETVKLSQTTTTKVRVKVKVKVK